ncbi:MAG: HAD family hydrolase [Nanoarchaeota archaeon]|nr:HAD family hydrolase [Nanoarchaeota archaeon]
MDSMLHTVLFDMDDTLVDTTPTIMRRLDRLVEKYQLAPSEIPNIYNLLANPGRVEILSKTCPFAGEFFGDYEALRAVIVVSPLADIKSLFGRIKASGLNTGVLTNNNYLSSKSKLSRCGLTERDLCGLFFHSGNLPCLKPNPHCFDVLPASLERKGIIYVGDAVSDYEAAHGAGLSFIAVTTGINTKEEFLSAGLAVRDILENIAEIENAIRRKDE